ncbi:MAG: DegT/DnrJ/EryC1/StrS family aminotransferase [Nitrospiraceae bacterium]|nr:MAG: DegT/DnrJ/EryC1/StrS family aminotransferase [Nitrospiraceae bacterium]
MMKNYKVRYFDYPLQFRVHEAEYMEIIRDVLSRGAYILGDDTRRFEKNLAAFTGSKYAVGVGNCTDALLLSLYAAGIGAGDEVITVSHTFAATVEVIKFLGATPVFVDIADDHNMDVRLLESAITPKTKAIVPVQLNGRICTDMDKIVDLAKKYNLLIIEDSAQALGASYRGKGAGTFGLAGCFSFYPAKLLGTFGDAGAIVTDDEGFAEKLMMLRNHGRGKGTDIERWGLNCRIDNLHSAILDYKMTLLQGWINRRREIAGMYNEELSGTGELRLPPPADGGSHYDVFQNYEIEAEDRDNLVKYLNEMGVEILLPWGGKAVHQFEALGLGGVNLPRTGELFRKVVMLPMYPELSDSQIRYIAGVINDFYGVRVSAVKTGAG